MTQARGAGAPPIGTQWAREGGYLVINEKEIKLLRRIHYYLTIGFSHRRTIEQLHKEGFRTRRGNLFTHQTITNYRRSEAYQRIESEEEGIVAEAQEAEGVA